MGRNGTIRPMGMQMVVAVDSEWNIIISDATTLATNLQEVTLVKDAQDCSQQPV